jgi:DNA-binding transcriptional ArsR family regulator
MADRAAKAALFDGLVVAARALSSGRRAEIVDVLAQGERSVEEIAGEVGQALANTSQHLQVLLRAGLVRTRRDGNRIYYRARDDHVEALVQEALHHAEHLGPAVPRHHLAGGRSA